MTLSINGNDIGDMVEAALAVISIVGLIVGVFLVWLMVRPPRHVRKARKHEAETPSAAEWAEMVRLLDRMEERLGVVESLVASDHQGPRRLGAEPEAPLFNLGEESPEARRTK